MTLIILIDNIDSLTVSFENGIRIAKNGHRLWSIKSENKSENPDVILQCVYNIDNS